MSTEFVAAMEDVLEVAETLRDALLPFREKWLEKLEEVGREKKQTIEAYRRSRNASG